jgi:dTDP-4-dehydrorhamnose 3,5-epimerase-like enzyme
VSNIVSSGVIDANGKVEAVVTYDDNTGRSENKYTITEYYDPRAEANISVIDQIQNIKSSLKIHGSDISNVKAGDIMDVPGGYSVTISYNDKSGTSMKYIIDEFYDLKLKAYDFIEDRALDLDLEAKLNKSISNVKSDDIQEIPGGYTTTISFQDSKNFTQKYIVNEFYDPKAKALFDIKNQIRSITNKSIINGNQISDLKVGKIQDIDGKYSVILSYNEKAGNSKNLTLNYFYDPKSKAIFDINNQIISIKNQSIINGDKITNLKIGKVIIL